MRGLLRDAAGRNFYLLWWFALMNENRVPSCAKPRHLITPSRDDAGYMHSVGLNPAIEIRYLVDGECAASEKTGLGSIFIEIQVRTHRSITASVRRQQGHPPLGIGDSVIVFDAGFRQGQHERSVASPPIA